MGFLESIEQLGAVRLLKSSFAAYPIISAMHIAAIGTLLTSVILLDLSILGRMRSMLLPAFQALFRRLALCAFAIAALTGAALFSVKASDYAEMPVFLLKLGLIAAAIANFLIFSAFGNGGGEAARVSFGLRLSAMASILLWSAVLLCGRFIGFL